MDKQIGHDSIGAYPLVHGWWGIVKGGKDHFYDCGPRPKMATCGTSFNSCMTMANAGSINKCGRCLYIMRITNG